MVLSLIESDVLAEADKRFSATSTYYSLPPVRGRVYAQALDGSGDEAVTRPRILDILMDRPTERVEATQQEFETIEAALKTWRRRIAIA